jgi:hypothetical protein
MTVGSRCSLSGFHGCSGRDEERSPNPLRGTEPRPCMSYPVFTNLPVMCVLLEVQIADPSSRTERRKEIKKEDWIGGASWERIRDPWIGRVHPIAVLTCVCLFEEPLRCSNTLGWNRSNCYPEINFVRQGCETRGAGGCLEVVGRYLSPMCSHATVKFAHQTPLQRISSLSLFRNWYICDFTLHIGRGEIIQSELYPHPHIPSPSFHPPMVLCAIPFRSIIPMALHWFPVLTLLHCYDFCWLMFECFRLYSLNPYGNADLFIDSCVFNDVLSTTQYIVLNGL